MPGRLRHLPRIPPGTRQGQPQVTSRKGHRRPHPGRLVPSSDLGPARKATGLPGVRIHDLRHAHASWLLAGGADLQVVKDRLGHASIATTEKYLHTLPTADETALEALTKIRSQGLARSA